MKIITQKKMLILLLILLLFSLSFNLVFAISGGVPEPGSEQDPIVSKSYVDLCIKSLTDEIEIVKKQKSSGENGFEVVSIDNGQVMYTGAGTEIILRSGKAYAIKGEGGGLSDTTSAKDLVNGAALSANHLLISSREDGRGIKANNKCVLLVRGGYRIEDEQKENEVSDVEKSKLSGTVKANILNVRAQPDTNSKVLVKLKNGDNVDVLNKNENWYQIVTSKGITGWVAEEYLVVK